MDVRFLRGLSTTFKAEGFVADSKTFYYLTDTNELYLGALLLSNEVTAAAFAAMEGRVKALEDLGLQAQIDAINQTLATLVSTAAFEEVNNRLKAVEADYLKAADKTELEGKINAKVAQADYDAHITAQSEKDAAQDALIAGKEEAGVAAGLVAALKTELQGEIDTDVKVVTDYIAANEEAWLEKYDDTALKAELEGKINGKEDAGVAAGLVNAAKEELQAAIDDVSEIAEAAQTAEEVGSAIDAKIAALNLATTYEPIGAEEKAKSYTDKKIDDLIKAYLDGETDDVINTLEEVAAWINNDTAGVAKIIEDVAKNAQAIADEKTARETADNTLTADLDKVEAKLGDVADNETVKDLINKALQAAKDYADENDANTVYDDTALAGRVSAIEGKLPDGTIADTDDITAAINGVSGDIAKGVEAHGWGNHANAGYAVAADIAGSLAKAESALQAADKTELEGKITNAANAAATAQGEVDALEEVVAANAQTCQSNFNTISQQLTWGSF